MRIAIVAANQGLVGGVETYLSWLLEALVRRGHHVAFAFEQPSTDPERVVALAVEPVLRWNLQALSGPVFLEELEAFRPDVVFMHALEDAALDVELTKRFRSVLFAHAFYATCATGWRMHRIPRREVCARLFGPACLPLNYLRGCGSRNPVPLLQLYSKQRTRKDVLKGLAGLVVASEYMRGLYLQHGVPDGNLRVIPPPAAFAPDQIPPDYRNSCGRVLFLGRLTSGKGAARAIQVVARSQQMLGRPLQLTLAGEGPELARCKALARELAVSTEFPGWVGPEQRMALLRSTDVLLIPSRWPEPFGIVGLEAASLGVPAVAYPIGGIVDWLRPGESGELANGTGLGAQALAEALTRALRDPDHHRSLQLGAWRAAHRFSGDQHVHRLETLFRDVTRGVPS